MPATLDTPARSGSRPLPDTHPADLPRTKRAKSESVQVPAKSKHAVDSELVESAFAKRNLTWRNLDPVNVVWIVGMHVGAVAAPFFFSWTALGVCLFLHWATCSIGICLGYHRYLSHKSLKLRAPAEFVAIYFGSISAEGRPLKWAATHRVHHQKSDHHGDPHSPLEGTWWSHLLWLFRKQSPAEERALLERYVPELAKRPILRLFEDHYALWLWGTGIGLGVIGYLLGGWFLCASMILWAMCFRVVISYHSTWFVNSATHLWGYRNYDTRDESRNLWWVALFAYGEGWHNNHHAHPSVAPAGHKWWEVDMTWWAIKALRAVGLAYDVKDQLPHSRRAAEDELAGPDDEAAETSETLAA
jgi:sn-2 palmitoyl-lipid 9-desaturase